MITIDDVSEFRCETTLRCKMCEEDRPEKVSPKEWSRLSFGSFHKEGEDGIYFQLWCDRHDCNVTTIHVPTDLWTYSDTLPLRVAE